MAIQNSIMFSNGDGRQYETQTQDCVECEKVKWWQAPVEKNFIRKGIRYDCFFVNNQMEGENIEGIRDIFKNNNRTNK